MLRLPSAVRKQNIDIVLVVVSVLIGVRKDWDFPYIVLFCILIWLLLNPVPSKVLAKAALISLPIAPACSLLGSPTRSTQAAVFTLLFFALSSLTALREAWLQRRPAR